MSPCLVRSSVCRCQRFWDTPTLNRRPSARTQSRETARISRYIMANADIFTFVPVQTDLERLQLEESYYLLWVPYG